MSGFVFVLLPLSVMLVFVLAGLAFADVALRIQPDSLHSAKVDGSKSKSATTFELTTTLQNLAGKFRHSGGKQTSCSCNTFVPLVTTPEAVAIADELRQSGEVEFQRVMQRSRSHGQSCPMLTQTGLCACSMTRPLACIGRCVVGGDSPDWVNGLGDTLSKALRQHLENQHVNAEARRLDDALVALVDRSRERVV